MDSEDLSGFFLLLASSSSSPIKSRAMLVEDKQLNKKTQY